MARTTCQNRENQKIRGGIMKEKDDVIFKLNTLRYVQAKMSEMHRIMVYVQRKFDELDLECNIPSNISLEMLEIQNTAKKVEQLTMLR